MGKQGRYVLEASLNGGDFHYFYHYPYKWWAKMYAWFWQDAEIKFRVVDTDSFEDGK